MKYFKLFEQFIQDDLFLVNESLEDDKKRLSELRKKENATRDKMDAIAKEFTDRDDYSFRDDPEYEKIAKEYKDLRDEVYNLDNKIYKEEQDQAEKERGAEKKKEEKKADPEEKPDVKLDDKTEAVLSKIEDAEDKVEYDLNYEFELVPTIQYRKIASGNKDTVNKVKDKLKKLQSVLPELKNAVHDIDDPSDKNQVKYAKADLASGEAEIMIYNACLAQDVKSLAKGLIVLAKAAKVLDALRDE